MHRSLFHLPQGVKGGRYNNKIKKLTGEFRLSGNHTLTQYEMSGEPYSQKSGWIKHSNEGIFQVMTFQ